MSFELHKSAGSLSTYTHTPTPFFRLGSLCSQEWNICPTSHSHWNTTRCPGLFLKLQPGWLALWITSSGRPDRRRKVTQPQVNQKDNRAISQRSGSSTTSPKLQRLQKSPEELVKRRILICRSGAEPEILHFCKTPRWCQYTRPLWCILNSKRTMQINTPRWLNGRLPGPSLAL